MLDLRSTLPGPLAAVPPILAVAGLVMLIAAMAACWLPARHAAALDPADVLRAD